MPLSSLDSELKDVSFCSHTYVPDQIYKSSLSVHCTCYMAIRLVEEMLSRSLVVKWPVTSPVKKPGPVPKDTGFLSSSPRIFDVRWAAKSIIEPSRYFFLLPDRILTNRWNDSSKERFLKSRCKPINIFPDYFLMK